MFHLNVMKKALLIALVFAVIALFWIVLSRYFTLSDIQRIARDSLAVARAHPFQVFGLLVLGHVIGMALSLPSKALMTLLSGVLMGPVWGSLATLSGVGIGTSGLFFAARYLLRDFVKRRLGARAEVVEQRLGRHPIRALIGLRLFITLPYAPITLAAAVTSMRYRHFIIGSLIGDLPVVVAYCFAGQQLFRLTSLSEAVSPWTMGILIAVGLFVFTTSVIGRSRRAH